MVMPIDKLYESPTQALNCVSDGDVIGIAGVEGHGEPERLLEELARLEVKHLKIVYDFPMLTNTKGMDVIVSLCEQTKVDKVITSNLPDYLYNHQTCGLRNAEIEFIDRNVIAEMLRVTGAGLGTVEFLRSSDMSSRHEGIKLDVGLIRGSQSDHLGNTIYSGSNRNWSPVIAMAARTTVVEVDSYVPIGSIDPEGIITPGIYVNRIVMANQ